MNIIKSWHAVLLKKERKKERKKELPHNCTYNAKLSTII
jgi:hypothetical protein